MSYALRMRSRVFGTAACCRVAWAVGFCRRRSVSSLHYPTAVAHHNDHHDRPESAPESAVARGKNKTRRITFLTDVEGDRQYLTRYVHQSKVLKFRDESPHLWADVGSPSSSLYFPYDHSIDFQSDDGCLVFGGDVWDQGGSDLYVIRQLLLLKRRYPDRVHFVMGNRDINKMRIVSELGGPGEARCPPHQLGGSARASPDPVERLKWILAKTMGSPRAFENRRWELEQERQGRCLDAVSDMDVVESYRSSCDPRLGEMSEYLSKAKLTVRLGEVLFLHGSLPIASALKLRDSMQESSSVWSDLTPFMPWLERGISAADANVNSVRDWLGSLDDFSRSRVERWKRDEAELADERLSEHPHSRNSYEDLIRYGVGRHPNGDEYPTVVRSGWCDDGMPRRFFPRSLESDQRFAAQTREFLKEARVRLICSGHQPQGDSPNVIRISQEGQQPAYVLICDTSYSGDTTWINLPNASTTRRNLGRETSRSGRGRNAVSEVLIEQCAVTGELLEVYFHGVLSDGTSFETIPLPLAVSYGGGSIASLVVGTLAPACSKTDLRAHGCTCTGNWWTRAALKDGTYLVSRGEGFNVWNQILTATDGTQPA